MNNIQAIQQLAARGALFVLNHSGGKDSQAMTLVVRQLVPASQLVVIYAELPGVTWEGCWQLINETNPDLPCFTTRAAKTFLGMVETRAATLKAEGSDASPWPSPKYRQCTSDLKRGPIEREIRRIAKARGCQLIVNCMGMRAQESTSRAKLRTLKLNARNSLAGREWYDWLPIHEMLIEAVFETIRRAGQTPHWAYAAGMTRLSCCFCIMASDQDIKTAARLRPELLDTYAALEAKIGKTMMMSQRPLREIAA